MQRTRSALKFGSPVRFSDRWEGRLSAFEVDDQWTVRNMIISRGLFRPAHVRLAFSVATAWDDDGVTLGCTSREVFGQKIPAEPIPPNPVSARTPFYVSDSTLAGALVDISTRRVFGLLLRRGLLGADVRVVPVAEAVFDGDAIRMSVQSDALPAYYRDSELVRAVRDALARHPYVTGDDRRALSVDVVDAIVYLSGNVRTPQVEAFAKEAAASVSGVLEVRGDVINDRELELEIGRALERAGLYRHGRIYARASLGEVSLGGYVSSEGVIADAKRAAGRVPGVRSITNLIQVSRTPPTAAA